MNLDSRIPDGSVYDATSSVRSFVLVREAVDRWKYVVLFVV